MLAAKAAAGPAGFAEPGGWVGIGDLAKPSARAGMEAVARLISALERDRRPKAVHPLAQRPPKRGGPAAKPFGLLATVFSPPGSTLTVPPTVPDGVAKIVVVLLQMLLHIAPLTLATLAPGLPTVPLTLPALASRTDALMLPAT